MTVQTVTIKNVTLIYSGQSYAFITTNEGIRLCVGGYLANDMLAGEKICVRFNNAHRWELVKDHRTGPVELGLEIVAA